MYRSIEISGYSSFEVGRTGAMDVWKGAYYCTKHDVLVAALSGNVPLPVQIFKALSSRRLPSLTGR